MPSIAARAVPGRRGPTGSLPDGPDFRGTIEVRALVRARHEQYTRDYVKTSFNVKDVKAHLFYRHKEVVPFVDSDRPATTVVVDPHTLFSH